MPRRNNVIKHARFIIAIDNCNTKRGFKDQIEAQKAAEYQMLVNPNLDLSIYKCDTCKKWHLTKDKNTKS